MAIGTESELDGAVGKVAQYLMRAGWHSGGTWPKNPTKLQGKVAEGEGVEPSGNNISRQAGFEDR